MQVKLHPKNNWRKEGENTWARGALIIIRNSRRTPTRNRLPIFAIHILPSRCNFPVLPLVRPKPASAGRRIPAPPRRRSPVRVGQFSRFTEISVVFHRGWVTGVSISLLQAQPRSIVVIVSLAFQVAFFLGFLATKRLHVAFWEGDRRIRVRVGLESEISGKFWEDNIIVLGRGWMGRNPRLSSNSSSSMGFSSLVISASWLWWWWWLSLSSSSAIVPLSKKLEIVREERRGWNITEY